MKIKENKKDVFYDENLPPVRGTTVINAAAQPVKVPKLIFGIFGFLLILEL